MEKKRKKDGPKFGSVSAPTVLEQMRRAWKEQTPMVGEEPALFAFKQMIQEDRQGFAREMLGLERSLLAIKARQTGKLEQFAAERDAAKEEVKVEAPKVDLGLTRCVELARRLLEGIR